MAALKHGQSVLALILVGLSKRLKQKTEIKLDQVENPNSKEANQLAIFKAWLETIRTNQAIGQQGAGTSSGCSIHSAKLLPR